MNSTPHSTSNSPTSPTRRRQSLPYHEQQLLSFAVTSPRVTQHKSIHIHTVNSDTTISQHVNKSHAFRFVVLVVCIACYIILYFIGRYYILSSLHSISSCLSPYSMHPRLWYESSEAITGNEKVRVNHINMPLLFDQLNCDHIASSTSNNCSIYAM